MEKGRSPSSIKPADPLVGFLRMRFVPSVVCWDMRKLYYRPGNYRIRIAIRGMELSPKTTPHQIQIGRKTVPSAGAISIIRKARPVLDFDTHRWRGGAGDFIWSGTEPLAGGDFAYSGNAIRPRFRGFPKIVADARFRLDGNGNIAHCAISLTPYAMQMRDLANPGRRGLCAISLSTERIAWPGNMAHARFR